MYLVPKYMIMFHKTCNMLLKRINLQFFVSILDHFECILLNKTKKSLEYVRHIIRIVKTINLKRIFYFQ